MLYAQFCACLFLLLILTLHIYSVIAHIKGLTHQMYIFHVSAFFDSVCMHMYELLSQCFLCFLIILFVQQLFQKIDTNKDKKTRNNKKWVLFPVT